ncbi:MAG: serine/threonine-protein kinase [Sandaracinaceae bacterium]
MPGAGAGADLLARDGHYRRVASQRRGAELALHLWPACFVADRIVGDVVAPDARLDWFILSRGLGQACLAITWLLLRRERTPGAVALFAIDVWVCTTLAVLISLGAAQYGGIASPLALGVVTLLIGRGALMPDASKRAAATLGLTALAFPATVLTLCVFDDRMRAQLAVPAELATFALFTGFVAAGALVAVSASHMASRLQQELLDATTISRYELLERIGSGGMGEVWRAHDRTLSREVAVKLLQNPARASDPAIVARFEREARATADLRHPHTIRVFDYGVTHEGTLYYAMELLEGQDLAARLREGPPLSDRQIVHIGIQVCHSLAEAHDKGLVHRDVKPANVFLARYAGEGLYVKLLDFGLAKLLEAPQKGEHALTRVGYAVGTPEYMAPEALSGAGVDARSDLYALGTILFRAITGRAPFQGELKDQLRQRMSMPPPSPSHVATRPVDPRLEEVLLRSIQLQPTQRYADALTMAEALAACLAPAPLDAPPTDEIATDELTTDERTSEDATLLDGAAL